MTRFRTFAGPATGGTGAPSFRALVAADVPTLNQNTAGSAASFTGTLAGDVTGTQGATTVAKIQGTTVQAPAGGATSYLDATGHWTTPAGGGSGTIDTSDPGTALGAASAGDSTRGAAAWNHVHPTTGLLTTSALVATNQGGTGVNASTPGNALAAMGGQPTSPPAGWVLRGTGSTVALTALQGSDVPGATNAAVGSVQYDSTLGDVQASPGTASLGGTVNKAAYVDHIHGQPTNFAPTRLTGATTPSRYIGGVSGAAPTGGTYNVGDWAVDKSGTPGFWICTTGSSPGPVAWSHIVTGTGLTNPMTTHGDTLYGGTVTGGVATPARLGVGSAGQVLTVAGGVPTWASPSVDWINVTLPPYNAKNDNSADATTAIQNAINAAPLGGTVYFPAGTYQVTKSIVIPPTISLVGSGRSFAADNGSQPMVIGTPVLKPTSTFATTNTVTVGGQA